MIISLLLITNLILISPQQTSADADSPGVDDTERSRALSSSTLGFKEISTGLPSKGDFSCIAIADFNKDSNIDIAFGGEDWSIQDSKGLYAFTGNGGTSWTNSTDHLWQGNSWGGLQLVDADEDGAMELYATDEDWGSKNNSGVHVWEFRNGKWNDNSAYVSSPDSSGQPCNVILTNVTGDSKLDMVVNRFQGIRYFENKGGNPITWQQRSTGLPTGNWYTGAAVADLNKDGLKDIVSTRNDQERMWIQSTSGNLWQEYSSGITTTGYMVGVAIADVNSDGHNDIIFGTSTPSDGYGIKIWLGNSGGTDGKSFTWTAANTGLPTLRRYSQIQLVDIDSDSDLDIVAPCSSGSEGLHIFLGNGSEKPGKYLGWTKATGTGLPTTGDWYGSNVFDIDGDGALDIVGASWGMGVRAWLNNLSLDATPPGAVLDISVIETTTDSIKIEWTAPADNLSDAASGPVKSYDIRYSTSPITLANWASADQVTGEPQPASPGVKQSINITGLASGTKYYFAIRSVDEIPNISPLSNIATGTTFGIPDTTPPIKITDLWTVETTHDTVKLTWTAPADNGSDTSSGPVAEYDLRYHSTSIADGNWASATKVTPPPEPGTPNTKETFTVTDLTPETLYYFAIRSRDEHPNWSLISTNTQGTTLAAPDVTPPSAVTDLATTNRALTSIELTWTAVGDDADVGTATSYDIRYATATITAATWDTAVICSGLPAPQEAGNTETYKVIGLEPDTKYFFAVMVSDDEEQWSPLSNIAEGTTLPEPDETPPAKITDLEAITPTLDSITLTWSAVGDDGLIGLASTYNIRYSETAITDANWVTAGEVTQSMVPKGNGETESIKVTGLLQGIEYFFTVKAGDETPLWSPLSNLASATTLEIPYLFLDLRAEKAELNSGEKIQLMVEVLDEDELKPVEGAEVQLTSSDPKAVLDPASGKIAANGFFNLTFTAPVVETPTAVVIETNASKEGFNRVKTNLTLTVYPLENPLEKNESYDLEVTDVDAEVDKKNGEVTVTAEITNNGPDNATDIIVRVLIDGEQVGEDEHIDDLDADGSIIIERISGIEPGEHDIDVIIVTSDAGAVSNPDDNSHALTINFEEEPVDDETEEKDSGSKSSSQFWTLMLLAMIVIILTTIILLVVISKMSRVPPPSYQLPESGTGGEDETDADEGDSGDSEEE